VAPAIFVAVSLAITVAAIAGRPGPSLWGAVIIGLGVPAYFLFKRRLR
jgi:hypothetical protein